MQAMAMIPPSTILAFDCSAAACSAALWRDGGNRAYRRKPMMRGHAEAMVPMILEVLADAGIRFEDLDAIAVTVGPGSFTGLRIGLSVARGIALAAAVPVIGVTTFAAVAESISLSARLDRQTMVLLDSRRAELYCQLYSVDLAPIGAPSMSMPENLNSLLPPGKLVLAGDGVAMARAAWPNEDPLVRVIAGSGPPDAAFIGPLAARLARSGGGLPPTPIYLRAADVHTGPSGAGPAGRGRSAPAAP
ncbi:MAG: tRNA (adenosine(37)-N6)-threonylcarbamoyltransferase complex dimerization subunit type 1 TsaB [Dongiaceae bacterium]